MQTHVLLMNVTLRQKLSVGAHLRHDVWSMGFSVLALFVLPILSLFCFLATSSVVL